LTALASADERTVLLMLPSKKEMYPLTTAAFTRAQNSRQRLSSDYRDALILDRDGELRQIERIDVLGPWGNSFARKLLSRLTDAWSISVHLSDPLPRSLDQIKQLLIDCATSPQALDNLQLESEVARAQFVTSVRAAATAGELLKLLRLPLPEDVLDVL
jgi:hypothetical protein